MIYWRTQPEDGLTSSSQQSDQLMPWLPPWVVWLAVIVIVAVTIAVAYASAHRSIERTVERELSGVAHLKAEQIANWLNERHRSVRIVVDSPLFVSAMNAWLDGEAGPAVTSRLVDHVKHGFSAAVFSNYCLRSATDGAPLSILSCHADSAELRELALAAARSKTPLLEDFHHNEQDPANIELGLMIPVSLDPGDGRKIVVHASLAPAGSLFPPLQQWPGASDSAEVLLVRRDGDDVVFLNRLRYNDEPMLGLRRPAGDSELLASQAVAGKAGIVRGLDYRGMPSVGYVMAISGAPWFLIAKMDLDDADAWLDRLAVAVAAALSLVALVAALWWLERGRMMALREAERRSAEAAIARKAHALAEAQRIAKIGNWDLDLRSGRVDCSMELCRMAGCGSGSCSEARLIGMFTDESQARLKEVFCNAAASKAFDEMELELLPREGRPGWLQMRAEVVCDEAGQAIRLRGTMQDVTERRRVREETQRYAAEIEDLYQHAPCGYHSTDAAGRVCMINDTELAWLGYDREQIGAETRLQDILTPGSQRRLDAVLPRLVATGHLNDLELDFVRKDGSILTALVNSLAIFDFAGRFVMARSSVIDISARKALEEERERQRERLASLSGRLVSVQEDERRRLSGELHDRTSPNLAALDVSLRTLARCLPLNGDGKAATLLDDAMAMLADTNESLREVCADLRPPVLDFAGLLPALQSYGQQFRRRCGIDVDVQWQGESARLDPQVESTLFRIAQEAFANCAKHAGATRVNVSIRTTASAVTMAIEDDGKGFAANDADGSRSGAGPGIVSMRERTQFLGGSLQVESVPGAGTRVSAVIPVVGGRVRASAPDFRAIALRTDLA